MTRQEITEKLKDIIKLVNSELVDVADNATENSTLSGDIGLDSVGMLVIVIAVEESFGVSFENANIGDFKTVGDVVDHIEASLK